MTSRDRRALILGGSVLLAGVLLLRVLPAGVRLWREQRHELTERERFLAEGEDALADVTSMEHEGDSTRARLVALAPRLLSGTTEAEALADLNGRLALAANRARTRMVRADQVPDSGRVARLHRVRLRVQVESDWSGMAAFLCAAVADPATLRIAALSIRSDEGAATSGPEILQGEVEVSGWYLGDPRAREAQ